MLGLDKTFDSRKGWIPSWSSGQSIVGRMKERVRTVTSRSKSAIEHLPPRRSMPTSSTATLLGSVSNGASAQPFESTELHASPKRKVSISSFLKQDPFSDSQGCSSRSSSELSIDSISSFSSFDLPLASKPKHGLEDKLRKFAKYGDRLKDAKWISPVFLNEIAQDSGTLLQLGDPEVMEQLYKSGLLKQMVETELIRRALEFFRLWVDARDTAKEPAIVEKWPTAGEV